VTTDRTPREGEEAPVFSFRLLRLDARDVDTIVKQDPDVLNRTDAIRAALRDYARKLRKRAERAG
jgi:hypothetical protein